MKRLFIVGLFCGAFLAVRFWGESPVAESAVAESARGQGGGVMVVSGNGDVNADNGLDLSDAIYLLTHLFQGGPPPALCPPAAGGAGGGSDDVGGGGGVGLGLPDTGAELCWDTFTLECKDQEQPGGLPVIERDCVDGMDNDADGRTDCLAPFKDFDCDGAPGCVHERDTPGAGTVANCTDGVDNDGDGLTDDADRDCCHGQTGIDIGCGPPEMHCSDGIDDDSDGLTDCKDPDCPSVQYDATEMPCSQTGDCPGQDAFYSTGCPAEDRYGARSHPPAVNGLVHETVTDRCTGLMWQRDHADFNEDGFISATGGSRSPEDRTTSWCEALRYCENLTYAGFSDWRLPNVRELQSIADARGPLPPPFEDEDRFDGGISNREPYYWTSTPSLKNPVNEVDWQGPSPKDPVPGVHVPAAWVIDFNLNISGGVFPQVDKILPPPLPPNPEYKIIYQQSHSGNLIRAVRTFAGGAGAGRGEGGGVDVVSGNGDVNADNGLDLSDAIYLLAHLFQGGPPPAPCPGTPLTETQCDDTQDNDGDGKTDCDDPDCSGLDGCPEAETDCTNGLDDDDDGDTDCDDPDCSDDVNCPEDCEDGVDNDGDGDLDCSDSECTGEANCGTTALGELPRTGVTDCYDENGDEILGGCANDVNCPGQDGDYLAGCSNNPRFVDHGDGTVTDTCTNLMWQKDTADTTGDGSVKRDDKMLRCDALTYCEDLTFPVPGAGYTDWRMPNFNELHSIIDFSQELPALDTNFFDVSASVDDPGDSRLWRHWTSTSAAATAHSSGSGADSEWNVWFDTGRMHSAGDWGEFLYDHIRAVRDAP